MDHKSRCNCDKVKSKLFHNQGKIPHEKDLTSNEEEDSNGREVDNPRCNDHHGLGESTEEVQKRFAFASHLGECDSKYDLKG